MLYRTLIGLLAAVALSGAAVANPEISSQLAEVIVLAERGDPAAQTFLALAYDLGNPVPENPELAARWYKKAANQGEGTAQLFLGAAYADGRGVRKNPLLAHKWLTLATKRLSERERELAASLRQRVDRELTLPQLARAHSITRDWERNHPPTRRLSTALAGY